MFTFHAEPAAKADSIKQVQPSAVVVRTYTAVRKDTYAIKLIDVFYFKTLFQLINNLYLK